MRINWSEVRLRTQPYLQPRWLQAWHVKRVRGRLSRDHVSSSPPPRRLFVDVSVITRNDAGTGIQRIVRAITTRLLSNPPPGWQVVLVGATRKRPYHAVEWPTRKPHQAFEYLQGRAGDIFLGLDFSLDDIRRHRKQLERFKRLGGRTWFVMYDLLPLQRPDWFSDALVVRFRAWLRTLATLADGFFCISSSVEQSLREALHGLYKLDSGFATEVLPMGWDIESAPCGTELQPGFESWLADLVQRRVVLMVGTLEPRKGHADVLAAFDLLWERGSDLRLVLVGRPGWKNDALLNAIRNHPRNGRDLFWLDSASDRTLARLYQACFGVLVASHAEGYGLPLLEALGHSKPVLARDLDVFRLHENRGVHYFAKDADTASLATEIENWLDSSQTIREAGKMEMPSWADAADFMLRSLRESH